MTSSLTLVGRLIQDDSQYVCLYAQPDATQEEALWTEEHASVTTRDGHFAVLLGNRRPIEPSLFATPNIFIGVSVDESAEMTPRQRFVSAPYAIYADRVSSLTTPDGKPGSAMSVDAEGKVSIGTSLPEAGLHIAGSTGVSVTTGVSTTMQINAGAQQIVVGNDGVFMDGRMHLDGTLFVSIGQGIGIGVEPLERTALVHVTPADDSTAYQG